MVRCIAMTALALSLFFCMENNAMAANEDLVRQNIASFCAQAKPNDFSFCVSKMQCHVLQEDCKKEETPQSRFWIVISILFFILCSFVLILNWLLVRTCVMNGRI